jgi:predicted acetyltransferase
VWDRVLVPRGEPVRGWVVEEHGRITGWMFVLQRRTEGGRYRLEATDLSAATPRAAARLLTLIADHGSLAREVVWFGGADDPLLLLPPELEARVELYSAWMLRVLDPVAALEGRGYAPAIRAELHLEIHDEIAPRCAGKFTVHVEGGAAQVRAGGQGRLRVHSRGLAALYSGHRSAEGLSATGLVEGAPDELRAATAVFAGPSPSMPDMF